MSTQVPINTEALFEPLLTSREAAPFVRLHYTTLELMARKGTVPGMKRGKGWVFRLSRLSKWIDQELESKSEPGNGIRRESRRTHCQHGREEDRYKERRSRPFRPRSAPAACRIVTISQSPDHAECNSEAPRLPSQPSANYRFFNSGSCWPVTETLKARRVFAQLEVSTLGKG